VRDRRVLVLAGAVAAHHVVVGSLFGLGDAEALYIVYGRHLQGGYLDHPPLVGVVLAVTTALCGESPGAARLPAALAFAASVLLTDLAVRRLGGSPRAGLVGALALVLPPVFFAGSLATTPDAIAAPLCLLALLAATRAMDTAKAGDALAAGALLGLATLAKVTAGLYAPGLVWLALRRGVRPGPIALAALAALCVVSPLVAWNAAHGGAMLLHRLVWTQPGAGLSLRNLGALVGGQLAYVGPPMLVAMGGALARRRSPSTDAFRLPAVPALAAVALLASWSRVAEPHWTVTALLPLVVGVGLCADDRAAASPFARRLWRAAVGWALVTAIVLHLLVLTPLLPRWLPASLYDARGDLANELHGWDAVAAAVRRAGRPGDLVAADHYTACAQLEVALGRGSRVHCLTDEIDDWDLWGRGRLPPGARAIFVAETRSSGPPLGGVHHSTTPSAGLMQPRRGAEPVAEVGVRRGGKLVRRFRLFRL
jgi:4-amino-4-deoxy-L-arabinose transferase-like glycosyltransferase